MEQARRAILGVSIVLLAVLLLFGCTQTQNNATDTNTQNNSTYAPQNTAGNSDAVTTQTTDATSTPSDVNIGEMYE